MKRTDKKVRHLKTTKIRTDFEIVAVERDDRSLTLDSRWSESQVQSFFRFRCDLNLKFVVVARRHPIQQLRAAEAFSVGCLSKMASASSSAQFYVQNHSLLGLVFGCYPIHWVCTVVAHCSRQKEKRIFYFRTTYHCSLLYFRDLQYDNQDSLLRYPTLKFVDFLLLFNESMFTDTPIAARSKTTCVRGDPSHNCHADEEIWPAQRSYYIEDPTILKVFLNKLKISNHWKKDGFLNF